MIRALKDRIVELLRFSERYTKTDMVYLASAGGWLFIARALAAVAGLAATFALAKLLTPESFGTYKFVLSLFGIIAAFSLSGIGTAVVQAVARGFEGAYKSAYRSSLIWSAPMSLIALGVAGYYFYNGNELLGTSLIIVALAAPFIQSGNLFDSYLVGKQKFKSEAVLGTLSAVVPLFSAVLLAALTSSTFFAVGGFLIASALTNAALYHYVLWRYAPRSNEDPETASFGKHLSVMGILGAISFQADRVLIFHELGAVALAVYALALAVPQQLRFGSKMLATAALPKLSSGDPAAIHKALPRKAFIIFLVSVAIAGSYILIAPLFFHTFFPEYAAAVPYSQFFALVILFFPATLYQQYLTARMEKEKLYLLQTVVPLVKIVLLFVLIPPYGIWGAIGAILGMELFRLFLIMYLFTKVHVPRT